MGTQQIMKTTTQITFPDTGDKEKAHVFKLFHVKDSDAIVLLIDDDENEHALWWVENKRGFPFCTLNPATFRATRRARKGTKLQLTLDTVPEANVVWIHRVVKGQTYELMGDTANEAPSEITHMEFCPRCKAIIAIDSPCNECDKTTVSQSGK